ncbi:ExeM/NucH family extracellular endonuclease [Pseudoduganella rhizocola]|uniref:ExeM/NucH family extracellular endonuclease n=1 Tax=Pseudoduganella rhizocola TaxID=3382643 RepID=UPI0038B54627
MSRFPKLRLSVLAAALAACGAPALAASDVVISQVYGGGGNAGATYKSDFIELLNRSTAPVVMNGWSVQYASASNGNWAVTALPAVTLQPGQYYLVQQATGSGGTVALVPDHTDNKAMSGTGGKVALSSSTAALSGTQPASSALVDLVGWGASTVGYEGTGPAGGTANATAVLRNGEGCEDSDNNAADFTVGTPTPRNTSSPVRQCNVAVEKPIVASCPAALAVGEGRAGGLQLSARDADSAVNGAAITSAAVPGISLQNFQAAADEGGMAGVRLQVAAGTPLGSYPVQVRFTNDEAQEASCTVNVSVVVPASPTRSIPQIQGPGPASPVAGTVQTTEGVVTRKIDGGFFLQDTAGDGDPATSDGIYVFSSDAAASVESGDVVRITGSVFEYTPGGASRSFTELKDVTATVVMGPGAMPSPVYAALPGDLARVEGMLVQFTQPLTVSQNAYLGSRGELSLSAGRLEIPTNRYLPGSAEAQAMAAANAASLIVLDDGLFQTPAAIPYIGQDNTVRAGDTVSGLTGVIDFGSYGGGGAGFKLQPVVQPLFSRDNPRDAAPALPSGNVKVASANVLNFFTTFTNGSNVAGQTGQGCKLGNTVNRSNCRGADNMVEFVRQRDKIVAALKGVDADVVGLMEIENNGDGSVGYLVQSLNAAYGSDVYAVVPAPAATGTDAIRVAMIYKPARVALVGGALADANAINNRPPMAQTFRAPNGGKFSLIVNHLKSKASCPSASDPEYEQGDGQGCWNPTRVQQAQRLVNSFVPQVVAAAGDPDVLLIGDMNAYGMEDPVRVMTGAGFVNQLERFIRPVALPYSYVYGHQAGYLDHALASASLSAQVQGAAEWHLNADEPEVIDYNTDGKPQDLYDNSPFRASDHDPVLISLDVQPSYTDVSAGVQTAAQGLYYNRATQKFSGNLMVTNTGGTALAGPLQVVLGGLGAGVTLSNASGSHEGAPYITLGAGLAPGATATVPLVFSNPSKGVINYAVSVYSGSF